MLKDEWFTKRVAKNSQWGGCFGDLGGKAPRRRRHGGFDKKIMLLKRGVKIGSANMIKLVA